MFKLNTMPKDTAAELLRYISEHEDLRSVEALEGCGVTVEESRALLRELAGELEREAASEGKPFNVKEFSALSKKAKDVISCLSPREEQSFLSAFGLIEKKQP